MEIPKKPRITTIILILLLNSSILSGEQTIKIINKKPKQKTTKLLFISSISHLTKKKHLRTSFCVYFTLLFFYYDNMKFIPLSVVKITLTPVRWLLFELICYRSVD